MADDNTSGSSRAGAATSPRSADDDSRLVALAREGSRAAFDELVRRHADGLYAVVVRLCAGAREAEEVTQEAFLRAWRGLPGFRGGSQFFTWLYRIGVNEARRRSQRSRRGALVVSLDDHRERDACDGSMRPDDRAERAELRREVDRAIGGLPVDHRAALVLRDIEGLSTAQAAAVLRSSRGGAQEPPASRTIGAATRTRRPRSGSGEPMISEHRFASTRLCAYRDGALPDGDARRVHDHLARCDLCRGALADVTTMATRLRSSNVRAPDGLADRVIAYLDAQSAAARLRVVWSASDDAVRGCHSSRAAGAAAVAREHLPRTLPLAFVIGLLITLLKVSGRCSQRA